MKLGFLSGFSDRRCAGAGLSGVPRGRLATRGGRRGGRTGLVSVLRGRLATRG